MTVERCPALGPHGLCQHDDGDGYWPAAMLQTTCTEEMAMPLAEQFAPKLRLPSEGWEWASDTVYVHVGPQVGWRDSGVVHDVIVSREVRRVPTPPPA